MYIHDVQPSEFLTAFPTDALLQAFQTFLVIPLSAALGFYIHSLFLTFFEQLFAVFMSYTVLVVFKEYQNTKPSTFVTKLIGAAYSAYINSSMGCYSLGSCTVFYGDIPFASGAPPPFGCSVPLSFGIAIIIKTIPGSDKIL